MSENNNNVSVILPSWTRVWRKYRGRKQTRCAIAFNVVTDAYRSK